jgi:hypothetical protein
MTDRVHGGVFAGEFLTGSMNFFSFATTVPVGSTNVDTPIQDLGNYQTYQNTNIWTPVTVTNSYGGSTTYSTMSSYLDAFYQQKNLDDLIEVFATRANPVMVNVKTFPSVVNGANVVGNTSTLWGEMGYQTATGGNIFGNGYSAGATVYIVSIATEHTLLWNASGNGNYQNTPANNTNEYGYNILSNNALYGGLDQRIAYDNQDTQIIGGSNTANGAQTSFYASANTIPPFIGVWDASGMSVNGVNVMANVMFFPK